LEDLDIDGKITLHKQGRRVWTGFIWLRIETGRVELSGSTKGEEFD
jgi:hypothetical protein